MRRLRRGANPPGANRRHEPAGSCNSALDSSAGLRILLVPVRVIRFDNPGFDRFLHRLDRRSEPDPAVERTVRTILDAVRLEGDRAVLRYTVEFGGPKLTPRRIRVTDAEIAAAGSDVPADVKRALRAVHRNVRAFARRSLRKDWSMRNGQGARVGERFDPFDRVGIYVPGGTAPLVSTAIMTVTLAAVAGVPEIAVTSPAGLDGSLNSALLFALELAGATEIHRIGGAQAIAALAFGTRTLRPVQKVFGPGNAYVVEAKRQVFGRIGVDLLPGPSEILVIADAGANPAWIAADLLAQAEHGKGSLALVASDSAPFLASVAAELERQASTLGRATHLGPVLQHGTHLILTRDLDAAVDLANRFAPEHLTLATRNPRQLATRIRTAGAIFLGHWSPVAAGDFAAGPSHELPTGGAGKAFPGLTTDMFQRRTSLVELDARSLARTAPLVEAIARVEGLDAHARSATIRVQS